MTNAVGKASRLKNENWKNVLVISDFLGVIYD